MLTEYIVDTAEMPWKQGETEGITFSNQVLLDGVDGGPEAVRFRFDPCPSVYAHMHLVSQFQFLLGGTMDLPRESMKLRPIAVHYTDHNKVYGPFSVGGEHDVLVLHPRQGGLVSMKDKTVRKKINLIGREISGMDKDAEWLPIPGHEGCRCKFLISGGPEVILFDLAPDVTLPLAAPCFGRYEVVLDGSVTLGERSLRGLAVRYVQGDEPAVPFSSSSEGATVAVLAFDEDAMSGGLANDELSISAAQQMARTI